jgi:hypothetical protein
VRLCEFLFGKLNPNPGSRVLDALASATPESVFFGRSDAESGLGDAPDGELFNPPSPDPGTCTDGNSNEGMVGTGTSSSGISFMSGNPLTSGNPDGFESLFDAEPELDPKFGAGPEANLANASVGELPEAGFAPALVSGGGANPSLGTSTSADNISGSTRFSNSWRSGGSL